MLEYNPAFSAHAKDLTTVVVRCANSGGGLDEVVLDILRESQRVKFLEPLRPKFVAPPSGC